MDNFLFVGQGPLSYYLAELERLAQKLVEEMPEFDLLDQPAEDKARSLLRQLMPQTPELLLDRVASRPERFSEGAVVKFVVPFSGTGALFRYTPSRRTETPPRGELAGALIISVPAAGEDKEAVEARFRDNVGAIEQWLQFVSDDLAPLEARLAARLKAPIAERRKRVINELAVDMVLYEAQAGATIPEISLTDLQDMMGRGEKLRLLDVLGEEHWKRGHLPHSEWIDFRALAGEAKGRFGADEWIIVYCKGFGCEPARIAAGKLRQLGFSNVHHYAGGLTEWVAAGLAVERT